MLRLVKQAEHGVLTIWSAPNNAGAILAKIVVGYLAEMAVHPLTGIVLNALAFSTLLSSQGTDAHRLRTLILFWGNPANLPVG
jgi:hypothetical protein